MKIEDLSVMYLAKHQGDMDKLQDLPENSNEIMEPKSLTDLRRRIGNYDIRKYRWRDYLTIEGNRGLFLGRLVEQYLGKYTEQRIAEYNPNPGARHLPKGKVVDWRDDENIAEQKQSPDTDNNSSRKENLRKLKSEARKSGLRPLYCYTQDRRKNRYRKQGVLHLHGIAIFEFLKIADKWENFLVDLNAAEALLVNELSQKFDNHFREMVLTKGMEALKISA